MLRSNEVSIEAGDELEAINDILAAIGESAVSTLEGDTNADVANARRILNRINRQVQSKGWTFNIEEGATLTPDVFSKLITYSPDYLVMLPVGGTIAYVNRGGYVYDRLNNTDQFESPIQVNLIRLKPYSEMPECFRSWIIAKASRQFNMRFFGATELDVILSQEEEEARIDCNTYEIESGNYNMLVGDVFVGGLLNR